MQFDHSSGGQQKLLIFLVPLQYPEMVTDADQNPHDLWAMKKYLPKEGLFYMNVLVFDFDIEVLN